MPRLPHDRIERPSRVTAGSEEQAQATRGGSVPQYAMPLNVILFLAAFWTAVIYGFATRDWLGALLWLTVGFVALTSERLTPARAEDDDAR